MNYLE